MLHMALTQNAVCEGPEKRLVFYWDAQENQLLEAFQLKKDSDWEILRLHLFHRKRTARSVTMNCLLYSFPLRKWHSSIFWKGDPATDSVKTNLGKHLSCWVTFPSSTELSEHLGERKVGAWEPFFPFERHQMWESPIVCALSPFRFHSKWLSSSIKLTQSVKTIVHLPSATSPCNILLCPCCPTSESHSEFELFMLTVVVFLDIWMYKLKCWWA